MRDRWRERPAPAGDALLDGATQAGPRSRAAAHWWSLVLALVLSPVAWYLVADGGARLALGEDSPWARGELSPAALTELAAGLVATAVVLLTARWSSLGALVTGTLVLLAGLTFVVVPARTAAFLEPALAWLRDLNDLGGNVAHHLLADGPSGRLALYGLALLLTGVVARGARRRGRAEERHARGLRAQHGPPGPPRQRPGLSRAAAPSGERAARKAGGREAGGPRSGRPGGGRPEAVRTERVRYVACDSLCEPRHLGDARMTLATGRT
ncbi:hypothetical protein [Georgenia sp. SUBG003]|uniref:hypothetical protein n=1 Tax=Georgenia sp. SUBG003 TaxID=1497974 RepID=UPI00069394AC